MDIHILQYEEELCSNSSLLPELKELIHYSTGNNHVNVHENLCLGAMNVNIFQMFVIYYSWKIKEKL